MLRVCEDYTCGGRRPSQSFTAQIWSKRRSRLCAAVREQNFICLDVQTKVLEWLYEAVKPNIIAPDLHQLHEFKTLRSEDAELIKQFQTLTYEWWRRCFCSDKCAAADAAAQTTQKQSKLAA